MAALLTYRSVLRRNMVPLSLGISTGVLIAAGRQSPVRLDSRPPSPATAAARPLSTGPNKSSSSRLDPGTVKQLSGGSLTGFVLGLVISVFSRTLVLLVGLSVVAIQVASRYGINLIDRFKLKKRIESSRVLSALNKNPVFKLSFGITFALAAFTSF